MYIRKYMVILLTFAISMTLLLGINRKTAFETLGNYNNVKTIGTSNVAYNEELGRINVTNSITVKSLAFENGGIIPLKYVCDKVHGGENVSIPIQWLSTSVGVKSYAVLMYDLNPVAKNFVHWAVINIPLNVSKIIEGASGSQYMPSLSVELKNSAGSIGYIGPCPPAGTGRHVYKIIVYALNTMYTDLSGKVTLDQFQLAIKGKVIALGEISGYFEQ